MIKTPHKSEFFINKNICLREFNYEQCHELIVPKAIVCIKKHTNLNKYQPFYYANNLYLHNIVTEDILGSYEIICKNKSNILWSSVIIPSRQLILRELGEKMYFIPRNFNQYK
jgi:hypothetical protein